MAITTLTPGVYIDEISTLPPSVAPVATAIPAFIGHTELDPFATITPTRITSLPEFVSIFGGAKKETFTISVADTPASRTISVTPPSSTPGYNLYYSLQLYFANGGGPCWIVSVGDYLTAASAGLFTNGLSAIEKIDEPTLLLFPDANALSDIDYGSVVIAALMQCNKLQDRFVISDVRDITLATVTSSYRNRIGTGNLKYGAAYMPFLNSVFNFAVDETVSVTTTGSTVPTGTALKDLNDPNASPITKYNPALYRQIYVELNKSTVTLPPSGAMAGIYASVDRDRGVWKAPANVSINAIAGPTISITAAEQGDLNVDATSGKSINAIRTFTGKGTLVWGSRTLAGNDNEWRYVPVRRLFIFAEESIKKASEFVVFEPNDKNTWDRTKSLISNFLTNLWRDGALAGATPKEAFFVKVGLGETMSAQDILEGKLIIQIGMAAVRPAEFIILEFMHKLQES
jgi:phage tail sheath protein FI